MNGRLLFSCLEERAAQPRGRRRRSISSSSSSSSSSSHPAQQGGPQSAHAPSPAALKVGHDAATTHASQQTHTPGHADAAPSPAPAAKVSRAILPMRVRVRSRLVEEPAGRVVISSIHRSFARTLSPLEAF